MAFPLTGIENSNEFYSQHYLDEVVEQDLKELFARWQEAEYFAAGASCAPWPATTFASREKVVKAKSQAGACRAHGYRRAAAEALGYETASANAMEFEDGALQVLRVTAAQTSNRCWSLPWRLMAKDVSESEWTALGSAPWRLRIVRRRARHLEIDWETAASKIVFADALRRAGCYSWATTSCSSSSAASGAARRCCASTCPKSSACATTDLFRAFAALASRESILPTEGIALVDTLDNNSHKHAYGVSGELKHALREAIEDIANEAIRYKREVPRTRSSTERTSIWPASYRTNAWSSCIGCSSCYTSKRGRSSGYAPVDAEAYLKGYSLEHLRDLENMPLTTPEAQTARTSTNRSRSCSR